MPVSPIKSVKKILEAMSPKKREKTITSLRKRNIEQKKQAERKRVIFNELNNLIKTGKELEKVNKKLKKLKI